jgi:hypothetical protein
MDRTTLARELVKVAKALAGQKKTASRLTLTVTGDGSVFDNNPAGEYARILENAARMMKSGRSKGKLLDVNGNTVGKYEVKQ